MCICSRGFHSVDYTDVAVLQLTNAKRTKQVELRTNYSVSLDDFTFITSSGSFSAMREGAHSFSAGDGSQTQHALLSPRASATVIGQSFTTDDIITSTSDNTPLSINNSVPGLGNAAPSGPDASPRAGLPPLSPRAQRGLASTSMPLTGVYGGTAGAEAPVVQQSAFSAAAAATNAQQMNMVRDKYVVFVLDSSDTVTRLSKLLARKGKALMGLAAAGHSVGLGVATAFNLTETTELLSSAGLDMADLDFAITNSGSEIWYCGAAVNGGKSSSSSSKQEPVMDDQYDHMLDVKWDLQSVRRVLAQCLQEKNFIQGTGNGTAAAGAARPRIRVESNSGTHHLVVNLRQGESEGAATAGGLAVSASEQVTLIGRIKRRFRNSGMRTQVVAQLENGDIKLHITPLRGSRALALRHLTYKHKVDMTSLVLVCCARELQTGPDGQAGHAKFACSDMEDVVAGVQGVLVVPPPADAVNGGDGFPVDLGLYTHDGRLQLLNLQK